MSSFDRYLHYQRRQNVLSTNRRIHVEPERNIRMPSLQLARNVVASDEHANFTWASGDIVLDILLSNATAAAVTKAHSFLPFLQCRPRWRHIRRTEAASKARRATSGSRCRGFPGRASKLSSTKRRCALTRMLLLNFYAEFDSCFTFLIFCFL